MAEFISYSARRRWDQHQTPLHHQLRRQQPALSSLPLTPPAAQAAAKEGRLPAARSLKGEMFISRPSIQLPELSGSLAQFCSYYQHVQLMADKLSSPGGSSSIPMLFCKDNNKQFKFSCIAGAIFSMFDMNSAFQESWLVKWHSVGINNKTS